MVLLTSGIVDEWLDPLRVVAQYCRLRRGTPRLVGIGRARCWVLRDRALLSTRLSAGRLTPNGPEVSGVRGGAEPEPRPHLENCTVDASIFVAKLLRAHGGCLGTRSRRRT